LARLIELGNEDDIMTGDVVMRRLAEDKVLFAEIVEKAGIVTQRRARMRAALGHSLVRPSDCSSKKLVHPSNM
jgi:hypothetical protein